AHNLGWGYAAYYTMLPELSVSSLLEADVHDFAQVFIDGKYIGKIDRVKNEKSLTIPPTKAGSLLVIVVEAMGRINFGRAIKDFKGIVGNVTISSKVGKHDVTYSLKGWEKYFVNDKYETALLALHRAYATENNEYIEGFKEDAKMMGGRGYYRGYFNINKVGDTFLNFETWGKGQVYVNGHAMGRIWSIGPQQTLYIPGCWLKKGKNEVIVLDVVGPKEPVVWGQDKPELNKLQLEKSNKHNNIGDKPDLNSQTPIISSQFKAGNGWQTITFPQAAKGRYLAIEINSTQSGDDVAAIAELYLQGTDGKRLSREPWIAKYADSENENGNHTLDKVYDLQESTYWQTTKGAGFPHLIVIDLGSVQTVKALEYLPRAEQGAPGSVKDYKIFVY
ncbi:MAG: beta-galactosidase, partial [Prevotella sp.]|nr:beta-galactosidase [Prevotella sp.]